MIVRCKSTRSDDDLLRERDFGVVLGREYLVLGLTINVASHALPRGAWVDILMEPDIPTLLNVPLSLFEIVDPRPSGYWEVRLFDEGMIRLQPASFYRESYMEDLSDREPESIEDFWRVYKMMQAEGATSTRPSQTVS